MLSFAPGLVTRFGTAIGAAFERVSPRWIPAVALLSERAFAVMPTESQSPAGSSAHDETLPAVPAAAPTEPPTQILPESSGPSASRPTTAGRRFGRYEFLEVLGRGGMGVVYKARHEGLQTLHAVKVLNASGQAAAELVERFRREGQILAHLRHPGIVQVHDIGEADGQTYLAMEYVAGESLDRRIHPGPNGAAPTDRGLAPAEAVRLAAEIADAVHCAHEAGVLHRDLKPANVLVEPSGRARVMDFGLAKMVEAGQGGGMTRSGDLMGTPAYLSPEHVGEGMKAVDAQSDVYQVGAILYEALTGRRPYDGDSAMAVISRISTEDPVPPRRWNPLIAQDAETICLRAMARSKSRRYASARELAEDCTRFLAGQAIHARKITWREQTGRWLTRHRLAVGVGILMLAALTEFGVSVVRAQAAKRQRLELEQQVLRGLRAVSGLAVDATLTLRRAGGRMSEARERFLPVLESAVREAEAKAPGLAEPQYHLGRMYRALLRLPESVVALEASLAREPENLRARCELAAAAAQLYGERTAALRDFWLRGQQSRAQADELGVSTDPRTWDALVSGDVEAGRWRALLERAAAGFATDSDRDADTAALAACVAGLRSAALSAETGSEEARALLQQALRLDPRLTDAHEALARMAWRAGDLQGAEAACEQGLAVDAGYLPLRVLRGDVRREWALLGAGRGEEARAWFQSAVADYDAAAALDAALLSTQLRAADARVDWARMEAARGGDPTVLWQRAREGYDAVLRQRPDDGAARRGRAALSTNEGLARERRGENPERWFAEAEADYAQALQVDASSADTWRMRAVLRMNRGVSAAVRGGDPRAHWDGAVRDCGEALRLDASDPENWLVRAGVRVNLGTHARRNGESAEAFNISAEADYAEALKRDGSLLRARLGRAMVRMNQAQIVQAAGGDPEPLTAAGLADLDEIVGRRPDHIESRGRRGQARMNAAVWRQARGEDPTELYAGAEEDFQSVLELGGVDAGVLVTLGMTRVNHAVCEEQAGRSPEALLARALADFDRALELGAGVAEPWLRRAVACAVQGNWLQAQGRDPEARYLDALTSFARALDLDAASAETWFRRGNARSNWALWLDRTGRDPAALFRDALADYDAALRLAPEDAEVIGARGRAHANWADVDRRRGKDATPRWRAALADLSRAVELNPGSAEHRWRRGWVHCALAQWPVAIEDFEAARRLNPATEPAWAEFLRTAREQAGGGK